MDSRTGVEVAKGSRGERIYKVNWVPECYREHVIERNKFVLGQAESLEACWLQSNFSTTNNYVKVADVSSIATL